MRLDELRSQTCRIVTHGRRSGAEHIVPVWFALIDTHFCAASRNGPAGDWLQNALHEGSLEVRAARNSWRGPASLVPPEEAPRVVEAFAAKYHRYPSIIAAWRDGAPTFVQAGLGHR